MIRRPPRSTLFPTRRSSDLASREVSDVPANFVARCRRHLLEIREKRARAIALEPEVDERMDGLPVRGFVGIDRKSTRLNSSHSQISYAVFCLKKKKNKKQ